MITTVRNHVFFLQGVYALIGSHESTNPRNFRVLISDGPIPSELNADRETTLSQASLPAFCVLIGENIRVSCSSLVCTVCSIVVSLQRVLTR